MVKQVTEFQKALLQGKGEQSRPFIKWFGKLYDYINDHLTPDEIQRLRNGLETTEIVGSIWMDLTSLISMLNSMFIVEEVSLNVVMKFQKK